MGKKIAQVLARYLPSTLRDAAGISGVGLISYGSWLIYAPAGYIVAGTLMVIGVLALSMKSE